MLKVVRESRIEIQLSMEPDQGLGMSISVQEVSKFYGTQAAVSAVSFDVPSNALFCIVGPSGCGKSTLLRLIAGLEVPDQGRILLGQDLVASEDRFVPPEERQVGVVFQSYALWPHMTVADNVAFPYEAQSAPRAEALTRAAEHLKTVALLDLAEHRPEALSGGQRQRVALARCLAGSAKTILMDEPLANLDPHLRSAMETELRAFHDRSGVTTLYITHDQREAMALADVMAVMSMGRFQQIGTPQEVYARPSSEMVARFIGRGAVILAEVDGMRANVLGQDFAVTGSGQGRCRILLRPRDFTVADDGWPGEITSVQYRGGYWEASVVGHGVDEPLKLDFDRPILIGETVRLRITGGWVLPD